MAIKKIDLVEKIKRRLGYPIVKIELEDKQILDYIDYARSKFITWAVGNATQESYCTVPLSAGKYEYNMPSGCVEVIGYYTKSTTTGINTLFTVENYLYNMGMYAPLSNSGSSDGYSILSYHIARDFLETVERYNVDQYFWKYHRYTNTLELDPIPSGDSPGYVLVHMYLIEGEDTDIYTRTWIIDYATALSKKTLGLIRRKFSNFSSIGNTGLSLDGDSLISEADAELEKLGESLKNDQVYEGGWIIMG